MPPTQGSAAIPIVRPSSTSSPASPTTQPATASTTAKPTARVCRNALIYGSCRFEGKGCAFDHPSPPSAPASPAPGSTSLSVASAANAAVFVPGGGGAGAGGSTLSMGAGAAEFVPRRAVTPALSEDAAFFTPAGGSNLSQSTREGGKGVAEGKQAVDQSQPGGMDAMAEYYQQALDLNAPEYRQTPSLDPTSAGLNPYAGYSHSLAPPGQNGGIPGLPPGSAAAAAAEAAYYNNGLGMNSHALASAMGFTRQPLQYHLYHPLPSTRPHHPHSALSRSSGSHSPTTTFFLPPSLHISLTQKSEATQATASSSALTMHLPEDVGGYTGLVPLDQVGNPGANGGGGAAGGSGSTGWAGYKGTLYKAWKEGEGRCYALRRIEGFRLQHEAAIAAVDKWTRVRHPGLISVREAFTTRAFGDQSIIFVYDYHPCSQTLYEAHLSPSASLPPNPWSNPSPLTHTPFRGPRSSPHPTSTPPASLPERVLWSYIVQIGSALKCVHQNGLAIRTLEVNRVVVTGKNRVRLGGASVMDCLTWDGGQNVAAYQQEDLLSFGKLIISLACGSPSAVHNLPKSVDHISRMYSPDLKNVVLYLLSKPGPRKTVEEVMALMATRVVDELNSSLVAEDTIERELMRELENGRLVRLLCKFGFINERPEFDHDPRWADTGDRYLIKLFRDYVFHQVDESGRPVTDLSHVLTQLNKLDAGVEEKIMLVSRDEASCLIVSYRELKNAIEGAYADLSRTG
ncbi:hypothetical protein JCM10212_000177 [Sporobolomyces blumeae]